MGSFLYVLIQFMRYETSYCKIIYKIEARSSCKMNPIWYMVRIPKLGASFQLEWWNAGIMENWVLGYCGVG